MKAPKEENKRYRVKVLQKSEDPNFRAMIIEKCRRDIIFFIDTFCWTYNPRLSKAHLPFVTYDFQEETILKIIDDIEKGRDVWIEKSRDMGASWMLVVIVVWGMLFKGWSSLYGSYKENYVDEKGNMDSFFERVRYVLDKLPQWMKPNDIIPKYMGVSSKQLGCEIAGDSGENFGTGGRRKFVIMDEFALWQFDEKAFRKTKDVTNCRIFLGTPEGEFNVYGKMMTGHKDYSHIDFDKITLHWTLHPEKSNGLKRIDTGESLDSEEGFKLWKLGVAVTSDWYESEKSKRTELDVAKELDINYIGSVTGAVYPRFTEDARIGKYEFNPNLKLYTSWDYGLDMNAVIWFQKDFKTNAIYIIDAFQKPNEEIRSFAGYVKGSPIAGYIYTDKELELIKKHEAWTFAYVSHFGDPYNAHNRSTINKQSTIATELKREGIYLTTKEGTTVEERIRKTTIAMKRMFINEDLTEFIQSITQSRYPQTRENSQNTRPKVLPIHNQCSHFRTALEYAIDNEPIQVKMNNIIPMKTKLKFK